MAEALPEAGRYFCHSCSAEISPRLPGTSRKKLSKTKHRECLLCKSPFPPGAEKKLCSKETLDDILKKAADSKPVFPWVSSRPFSCHSFRNRRYPKWKSSSDQVTWRDQKRKRTNFMFGGPSKDDRKCFHTKKKTSQLKCTTNLKIIQQLVNGIIAPTAMPNLGLGPWGVLHSNPMDYAWGANGLDTIITQLLNQFENTGPPPADNEKIQALPTIQVTDEHVGSGLECPVCKEDYTVGENVRQLPCNHLFHNNCIIPWLEQHDTCPVCRKSLSGQNTATNPPGLTDMNFSASSASSSSSTSPTDENNSANNS
ncbi:E3 ubiquitin-protein ligase RNF126 [Anomaloglossus baeobatrachus]|uniref:E3 ubiquitin-protein ligase RNF126 n=1 Tax=Anomaloglossus baeobatrachus TaxID=238106 RepID=UPI003F501481